MPRASLTRRVTFSAAHRYRRPEWSDEENERVFGLCARKNFHGHTWACDVTVAGEIDPLTGFVMDLAELDRILDEEVRQRLDHRNINMDVSEFADGGLIPSGENLALYIHDRVSERLDGGLKLVSVRVIEDEGLSATFGDTE